MFLSDMGKIIKRFVCKGFKEWSQIGISKSGATRVLTHTFKVILETREDGGHGEREDFILY